MKNATDKKPLPKPFEMPDTFPGLHALSTINATDIRAGVALSNCTADRKRIKDYQYVGFFIIDIIGGGCRGEEIC